MFSWEFLTFLWYHETEDSGVHSFSIHFSNLYMILLILSEECQMSSDVLKSLEKYLFELSANLRGAKY